MPGEVAGLHVGDEHVLEPTVQVLTEELELLDSPDFPVQAIGDLHLDEVTIRAVGDYSFYLSIREFIKQIAHGFLICLSEPVADLLHKSLFVGITQLEQLADLVFAIGKNGLESEASDEHFAGVAVDGNGEYHEAVWRTEVQTIC